MRTTVKRVRVRNVQREQVPDESFDYEQIGTTNDGVQIVRAAPRAAAAQPTTMMARIADHPITQAAAPLVGAVGGALATTVAIERFGVRREVATLGGAALAFTAAQNTTGITKAVLDGVAMAGLSMCVVELLRAHRPEAIFGKQAPVVEHRQAAPPTDAITREDLVAAVAEMQAKNAATNAEREKLVQEQMQQMTAMIDGLLGQLRAASSEIASLRAAAAAFQHERNAAAEALVEANARADQLEQTIASDPVMAETEAEQIASEEPTPDPSPEEEQLDATQTADSRDAAPATPSFEAPGYTFAPETVAHFQASYALLDENERRKLSLLVATMPKDVVSRAEAHLATLSPSDAVGYLRTSLFPSVPVA